VPRAPSSRRCCQPHFLRRLLSMVPWGQWVSPPGPHNNSGHGPETFGCGRWGSAHRSRGKRVCIAALAGSPDCVGTWSEDNYPHQGSSGGSRPCSSAKTDHKNITNPLQSPRKAKTVNLKPKQTAVNKKEKQDSSGGILPLSLKTKNVANSPRFPSITHTARSD
jgi:hypothetical protein